MAWKFKWPKRYTFEYFFQHFFKRWKISNTYGNNVITKPLKSQCPASMVAGHMTGPVSGISTHSLTLDYFEANVRYPNILSANNLVYIYIYICIYTHTDIHTSMSSPPLSSITLLYLVILKCPSWKNECQTKNSVIYTMFFNV